MNKVGIIVLNYNGFSDTLECLQSLMKSDFSNFVVMVVDNASSGEDVKKLTQEIVDERFEFIENDRNYGFAEGNNIAIRQLMKRDDVGYIMLLNNDTEILENSIGEMVKKFEGGNKKMVGIKAMDYYRREHIDNRGIVFHSSFLAGNALKKDIIFAPSGCAVMYHRSFFSDIEIDGEYLDADFFCYGEDVDLGLRGVLLGYESVMVENTHIYHKGSATAGKKSDFSIFHGHRNNVLYAIKSVPVSVWAVFGWAFIIGQIATFVYYLFKGRPLLFLKAKFSAARLIPKILKKRRIILAKKTASYRSFVEHFDNRLFVIGK